jgi:hypothetical protein
MSINTIDGALVSHINTVKVVWQGVCGLVVKVDDFNPLIPCACESRNGLSILLCEEATQLA